MINKMPKDVQDELKILKETTTKEYYLNKVKLCEEIFVNKSFDKVTRWEVYNAYLMTEIISKIKDEDLINKAYDMIESCQESL